MINENNIPSLFNGVRFQWEEAQKCHVLLYPEGMVQLNGSAGEILSYVNGQSSIIKIADSLQEKFPTENNILKDVLDFMEVAIEKKWITFESN